MPVARSKRTRGRDEEVEVPENADEEGTAEEEKERVARSPSTFMLPLAV